MIFIIIEMLESIDVLGPEVKIMLGKNSEYKSKVGGTMTILLVILAALAFVAFGRDLFQKKLPVIVKNTIYDPQPNYTINNETIFMFTFVDNNNGPLEIPKMFNAYFQTGCAHPQYLVDGN